MNAGRLDIEERGSATIVRVSGDVDAANATTLQLALDSAVEHATDLVVLDLTAVTYLDSAGIHLLFQLNRRLEQRSVRLQLVVPDGSVVQDTLRYADVLGQFGVVPDADAATG